MPGRCDACRPKRAAEHSYQWRDRNRSHERDLLYSAKQRARLKNLPFDLELEDIQIPERCPIFGIPLESSGGLSNPNLATLDRLVPEKGYVRGNVWVISWRANRMKGDASLDELRTLVAALNARVAS